MTDRKPNVVFVLTDDQGYGDLGCTGNDIVRTPNIDRFHDESIRFTNYHVGPTCAPTRAGLMTGHFANSTGVWHTIGGRSLLREQEWTLPEALRSSGYRTGLFGKWHLGDAPPYLPNERGFDLALHHGGGGISQVPDWWGNDYFDDTYSVNGEPRKFSGYCTDVFFSEALKFIEQNRDAPFFVEIATNAPHGPLNIDDHYVKPYRDLVPENRARFYGMIENIDENFGRLRETLDRLGLAENTIVIFMTDNGTASGVGLDGEGHVTDGYNAGMRGMKNSPYDGGHRVPFFLYAPDGRLGASRDIATLTANVDFMPTLLELCGVDLPPERSFHGRSLSPLLVADDPERIQADFAERVVVTDSQRVPRPVKWRKSAAMKGSWRLVNGRELYDVSADPGQRSDVAGDHPDLVAELRDAYEQWWQLCSVQFDKETPIALGATDEVVTLTSHDWRNDGGACGNHVVFHQGQVRDGQMANGRWEIDVKRTGEYQIELRRWPRESGHKLNDGIEGDDIDFRRDAVAPKDIGYYTGGVSLDIGMAVLRVGGHELAAEVDPNDESVRFNVVMDAGPTRMETFFVPRIDKGDPVRGAYYAYCTYTAKPETR